ncbi:ATP-binding cassette, subfamily B, RaxB [Marinomonas polaris DSM 16579]|uniref:ATP-binding cassette, subfamily B, RaxB n=1 Tax=Marinomonas polaris DSM 16579 TaxID=1122206 RepID=A0A1M5HGQ0_9GAMM|nr:peptidase domain-containing ABC transporter [Marinomonas polaris]SHG15058.1 ATP-binding cassette, subfamily B, RaxB [Marinomonas polaris DSM 16579]|tara:strand:+ start:16473 stop:18557 length:2085 start_codon:yes stop_codon:yes gene_type:complete
MKAILQSESHECGLACLVMIASAYGSHLDLPTLRRRFSISVKGTSLPQILHYAQSLDFSSRPVRLELDELKQLRLPCILHWSLNHFVVLEKVGAQKVTILDPAAGRRTLTMDEVSRCFTGVALELTPNSRFQSAEKKPRLRLRELTGHVLGLKRALVNILMLALALEVVALLSPQVMQWVVDHALVSADYDLLLLVVIGGCLLLVIDFVLRMARGWMGLRLNQQLTLQWTSNFFHHLLRLPWSFFEKRHLGDITARFQSLDAIRAVITNGAVTILLDALVALITLTLMTLYSKMLTVIVLTAVALYVLLRWAFYVPLRNAMEERIVLATRENAYFLETIRAVQPLKLFNSTPLRLATWQNLLTDVQNRDLRTQKMLLVFGGCNTLIFGLEGMLLLYVGGVAVLGNTLTLGMLLAFLAYKSQFTTRASKLIDLGIEIKMLSLHGERLAEIALETPEPNIAIETDLSRIEPRIEFKNVSFRYADGEHWVIKDLSFTIEAGDAVALIGRSGCGKSTLFKLMLGLLEPIEGDIRIGGTSIRQLGPTALRNMVGVVMQDDQLMAGSLAENIACFEVGATQERIEAAAQQANIHKTIINMPMGYQTLVAEMGSGLSGGQKQRLLLARALYKQPSILALDEATSHLDLHGEQHVVSNLQSLSMTRVVIAHRRETVAMVSRIIHLEQGKITEDIRLDADEVA